MTEEAAVEGDKLEIFRVYLEKAVSEGESGQQHRELIARVVGSLQESNLKALVVNGVGEGKRIDDVFLSYIFRALSRASIKLENLQLPSHNITAVGVNDYINEIVNVGTLYNLDLYGNDISGSSIKNIGLSCPESNLQSLNISCNRDVARVGGMLLAEALETNKTLKHLFANNCGFDLTALIAMITSLYDNVFLETLELDRPLLNTNSQEESDHIGRLLSHSSSLTRLSLRHSRIDDVGAKFLTNSLFSSRSMRQLNLESNDIGVSGAEALASYLIVAGEDTIGLEALHLSYNRIGNEGCLALAHALTKNGVLQVLTIRNNKIGRALEDLAKALSINNTLQRLALFGNNFDQIAGCSFHDRLENRFPFTGLQLDIRTYVVDGSYSVSETKLPQ